jgi:hypothetical protein
VTSAGAIASRSSGSASQRANGASPPGVRSTASTVWVRRSADQSGPKPRASAPHQSVTTSPSRPWAPRSGEALPGGGASAT